MVCRFVSFYSRIIFGIAILSAVANLSKAQADEALVAVASNFAETLQKLKIEFERDTSHQITISIGSTGKIYAQLLNGAPFDIFLSADQARPALLEKAQKLVPGSRFTYATGRLTLWSANSKFIDEDGKAALQSGKFATLAMANPLLAPYGRAAREVLQSINLWQRLRAKIVEGQNIGQTFSFVATGNAELGFVALSYVMSPRNQVSGSRWNVPVDLYQPIRQDGVLMARAAKNPAAIAFLEYLKSPKARSLIARFGYGLE